jgi:hypothetical protein
MTRDQIIETMARAICAADGRECEELHPCDRGPPCTCPRYVWEAHREKASNTLEALCIAIPGLSDIVDGKAVPVPVEPTEEMIVAGDTSYRCADGAVCMDPAEECYISMLRASPYATKPSDVDAGK